MLSFIVICIVITSRCVSCLLFCISTKFALAHQSVLGLAAVRSVSTQLMVMAGDVYKQTQPLCDSSRFFSISIQTGLT